MFSRIAKRRSAYRAGKLGVRAYDAGDYQTAHDHFLVAAEAGVIAAQLNLGKCYLDGEGVQPDLEKACQWFERAARQGSSEGQLMSGFARVQLGENVAAYKWFKLASKASLNRSMAVNNLVTIAQDMSDEEIAEAQAEAREFRPKMERIV